MHGVSVGETIKYAVRDLPSAGDVRVLENIS